MTSIDDLIRDSVAFKDNDSTEQADIRRAREAFSSVLTGGNRTSRRSRARHHQSARVLRLVSAAMACSIALVIGIGAVVLIHQRSSGPGSIAPKVMRPGARSSTISAATAAAAQRLHRAVEAAPCSVVSAGAVARDIPSAGLRTAPQAVGAACQVANQTASVSISFAKPGSLPAGQTAKFVPIPFGGGIRAEAMQGNGAIDVTWEQDGLQLNVGFAEAVGVSDRVTLNQVVKLAEDVESRFAKVIRRVGGTVKTNG